MAGALIGLAAGTALSYAGSRHRERLEREQAGEHFMKESFIKNVQDHPEVLMDGKLDKQGKSLFGSDWENIKAPMMPAAAEAARQQTIKHAAQQQLATLLGVPAGAFGAPAGGQQQPPASVPSPGTSPLRATSGGASLSAVPPSVGGLQPQDISAQAAPTPTPSPQAVPGPPLAAGAPSPAPAPPQVGAAPFMGAATAPLAPQQKLEQLQAARAAVGLAGMDDTFTKNLTGSLDEQIKSLQQQISAEKPPAELEAVTHAYFGGRHYNDLSPGEQQAALKLYQQIKEDPAFQTFARQQTEWNRRWDISQKAKQDAETRRDRQAQIKYGGAMRQSIVALMTKQSSQMIALNKPNVTQEERQAGIESMNNEVDAMTQGINDDVNAGILPDSFTPPKQFKHYKLDPKTGGVIAEVTKGYLGMSPGTIHLDDDGGGKSTTPSGDASPLGLVPKELWGKSGVLGPDGRRWNIDANGNPTEVK